MNVVRLSHDRVTYSSIKLTRTEASLKKNESIVYKNLYEDLHTSTPIHFNFSVGERVGIVKKKKAFEKGILHGGQKKYLQFQTSNIPDRLRIRYRITRVKILIIQGTFY